MSTPKGLYDVVSKFFLITPVLISPSTFLHDAPFGRFSPSKPSRFLVDGIKSWIIMEIFSPLCFLAAFLSSPLTRPVPLLKKFPLSLPPLFVDVSFTTVKLYAPNATTLLALMFLGHYLHRALLSPLRTPARSKSHISVPLAAIAFNVINGSMIGAFIAALATPEGHSGFGNIWYSRSTVCSNWTFWTGVGMWALGFASNIWHDEVLLNLRRTPKTMDNQKVSEKQQPDPKPRYGIPRGGLYTFISYPNYFSEWFEWFGYAVAASALTSQLPSTHVVFPFAADRSGLGALSTLPYIQQLTPPWVFFISEVFLMFPRAWNGHKWYHKTFPEYPRERKAVIPFLL